MQKRCCWNGSDSKKQNKKLKIVRWVWVRKWEKGKCPTINLRMLWAAFLLTPTATWSRVILASKAGCTELASTLGEVTAVTWLPSPPNKFWNSAEKKLSSDVQFGNLIFRSMKLLPIRHEFVLMLQQVWLSSSSENYNYPLVFRLSLK